ncbi:MAG: flagellar hook-associated protein FlgK [Pseudomonadales bacterium]|nr:flagellar hook-associated protein FlgK [Pseudomonadales bacterium]
MANLINTAISGLKLSQLALSVTGQNIVNANTEGYSRQSVTAATTAAQKTTAGYLGTGVQAVDIKRNTQQFLVDQVSRDISVLSNFDTYLTNISQMDSLLANPNSSLSTTLENFFGALNEAANDPSSLLGRQLLLTQTQLLTQGFQTLEAKLVSQNSAINSQFDALAGNVTTLAQEIAKLNDAIANTVSVSGAQLPNDLLDQRDQLVRNLSALVDVNVTRHGDETIDVFIAEGQGLVIGSTAREVVSAAGPAESDRRELAFVAGNVTRIITNQVTGGELGGLIRFRNDALEPALNSLGRITLAVADGLNQQQVLGIDLEGNLGARIFTDINDPKLVQNRVLADTSNKLPNDRVLRVHIDDVNQLQPSDYQMKFEGVGRQYSIVRESDGKLMAEGVLTDKLPLDISIDGFTLTLESGSFQSGDKFTILPTKTGISDINVQITRPEAFAFATPIRTQMGAGNSGGAFIHPGVVTDIDTPAFTTNPGQLSPPILIRFTSPTTYDVLDYSDPANPISLQPPLNNQSYAPGSVQEVFPSDPGGTTVSTGGSAAARINIGEGRNGYQQELLTFNTTDPVTGYANEQHLLIEQNESAQSIAQRLSQLSGVKANAFSQMQLYDFVSDNVGVPLTVSLNGINLTDPTFIADGENLPQAIPDPLNADFLRDRINASGALQQLGIRASSDGEYLTVRSTTGVDLKVEVGGNAGDSIAVRDGDLRSVTGRSNLTFGMTVDVGTGFNIDLGSGKWYVPLTPGSYAQRDIAEAVQADVDAAIGAGVVNVSLNAEGRLEFSSVGDKRVVKITDVSVKDPIGLAPMRISGPDVGALAAVLSNGLDANEPHNFSGGNASTFLLVVDGVYSSNITLNQNYAVNSAATIAADIQAQIDASVGTNGLAGHVTVDVDGDGVLRFTSTTTGELAKISIAANSSTQGLIKSGTAVGQDTGGSNASLLGNVSLMDGFNFDVAGPHSFNINVDGHDAVPVTLSGSSALPAVFTGNQDVSGGIDFSVGVHSFNLSVNGAVAVPINLAGVNTALALNPDDVTPPGILTHVQARLDAALGPGIVTAGLDSNNFLTLTSASKGDSAGLTISAVAGGAASMLPAAGGNVAGTELGAAGVATLIRDAINTALAAEGIDPIRVGVSPQGTLTLDSNTYGASSALAISNVQGTYGALFASGARGEAHTNAFTVGGTLDVQLAANTQLSSSRRDGLFGAQPKAVSNYLGYQVSIGSGLGSEGAPQAGDSFLISYNTDGTADNRNGVAMANLNTDLTLANGKLTYQGAYGQLVENTGVLTSQARLSQQASETLLRQSMDSLQGVAGVNLEEEAARLIQFEQHYNASARLISMAKELFDTIVNI